MCESFVYFYYDKNDEIIYVGQAIDVWNRWQGHLESWKKEVCKIGVREYPDRAIMDVFERYYIAKFLPKYNIAFANRGRTTVDIHDPIELKVYTLNEFAEKYMPKKTKINKERAYIPYEEQLKKKGILIVDVDRVNLFDEKWDEYDLDKTWFRHKDIYYSPNTTSLEKYSIKKEPKATNKRIKSLQLILKHAISIQSKNVTYQLPEDVDIYEVLSKADEVGKIEITTCRASKTRESLGFYYEHFVSFRKIQTEDGIKRVARFSDCEAYDETIVSTNQHFFLNADFFVVDLVKLHNMLNK